MKKTIRKYINKVLPSSSAGKTVSLLIIFTEYFKLFYVFKIIFL